MKCRIDVCKDTGRLIARGLPKTIVPDTLPEIRKLNGKLYEIDNWGIGMNFLMYEVGSGYRDYYVTEVSDETS